MDELESKVAKQKLALLSALQNDTAVVSGMNPAISAIYLAAGPIIHKVNVQVSLSNVKEDLRKLPHFEEGMTIANQTVDRIMATWWKGNTQLLIENLKWLTENSLSICSKCVATKLPKNYHQNYTNYVNAIKFAALYKKDLINYMGTIGSIDRFDEGQRNASSNTTNKLLGNKFAKQLEVILDDMNALKVSAREIRKERAQLLAARQKNEEERRHSCTDLWSQLLTLVRLK
ncbi:hypothetical protein, conserved in T. vivax [Trypanosoma vivax Y486]|uniref:Uncharacterized protein n=1 Tax=Trypanosoma vivax (strain Y486) TaxID=1055687 RepID=F9WMP5_TRYVY|nr:hypothetical protein, conserved in T. vivax [Trypanosoma vivax Y486]|eukprot:CCD18805.1 hypothetical protein, conserved in T. vivax [Trypanosoma vivax Y486]